MTRIKVNSEEVLSVGYEPDSESLELEFPCRSIYEYHKVHPVIFMGLMYTDLKGAYFDQHIKNKFQYTVVRNGQDNVS